MPKAYCHALSDCLADLKLQKKSIYALISTFTALLQPRKREEDLDAHMVGHTMQRLDLQDDSLLLIENVGNLVCPASFDLEEAHKVMIFSVTEGKDKPLKYPDMFRAADLMLINKCDLLPHLTFDADLAIEYAQRIKPALQVMRISTTRDEGMQQWLDWIAVGCHKALMTKYISTAAENKA